MKLKDILNIVKTYNRIKLSIASGEEIFPSYADLTTYKEYCVVSLDATDKREFLISVRPFD